MTTYGMTPQGFRRKPQSVILSEIESDERAGVRDDFDVSTASVPGQMNGAFSRQLGIAWEQLEILAGGNDPEASENRLLEMLCKLTGTFRTGDTQSEVELTCNLDVGTTIEAGIHFAALEDQPDIRWTPREDFEAPSTGNHSVVFVAEQPGPVAGPAGEINVIATPIVGWNTVVNPDDAELGKRSNTDTELKLRREREMAAVGSATVRAITAKLSQAFPDDLENLIVFENDTDLTDVNGVPPKSVEALIFDGVVPSIPNNDVAQIVYDSKAGGIRGYGNTSGNAQALVNGVESTKLVGFSRAVQRDVYLVYQLTKLSNYVGDSAVKAYVAAAANAHFRPGDAAIHSVLQSFPLALAGVKDVVSCKLGFAPSPSGEVNLAILIREITRYDTSRIVIV